MASSSQESDTTLRGSDASAGSPARFQDESSLSSAPASPAATATGEDRSLAAKAEGERALAMARAHAADASLHLISAMSGMRCDTDSFSAVMREDLQPSVVVRDVLTSPTGDASKGAIPKTKAPKAKATRAKESAGKTTGSTQGAQASADAHLMESSDKTEEAKGEEYKPPPNQPDTSEYRRGSIHGMADAEWKDLPLNRKASGESVKRLIECVARCGFVCPVVGCTKEYPVGTGNLFIRSPELNERVITLPSHLVVSIRLTGWWDHWEAHHVPEEFSSTIDCAVLTKTKAVCGARLRTSKPSDVVRHFTTDKHRLSKADASAQAKVILSCLQSNLGKRPSSPTILGTEYVSWFRAGYRAQFGERYSGPFFGSDPVPDEEATSPVVSDNETPAKQGKGKAGGEWTKVKGKQASTSRASQKRKRTQSPAVSASKQMNPPASKYTKKTKAAAKLELEKKRQASQQLKKTASPPIQTRWTTTMKDKNLKAQRARSSADLAWHTARTTKEALRLIRSDDKMTPLERQKRTKAEVDKLMISYARLSSKLALSIKEQTGANLPPPFIPLTNEMIEAASAELAKAGTKRE